MSEYFYEQPNRADKPEWWRVMRHEAPWLHPASARLNPKHRIRTSCKPGCQFDVVAVDFVKSKEEAVNLAFSLRIGTLKYDVIQRARNPTHHLLIR
jgi:hypothetical protein